MATVRLTWTDPNSGFRQEDEIRIYRATAPFDAGTLPAVLATLPADTLTYDDATAASETSYWYAVAAEKSGVLAIAFSDEHVTSTEPSYLPNYFDGDFSTQTHTSSAIWPCAVYDATSNKTFYTWLAEGSPQLARIAAYDHTAGIWSAAVTVDRQDSYTDDVHGVPAIVLDHQGYIYVFWGNHVGNQRWAISASPRDITSWNVKTPISGSYTYPHPVRVGTDLYLLMSSGSTSDSKFVVRKASPSGGTATFGAEVNLIDWTPANVGIYVGEARYNGTEIEFMACQQTGLSPQVRKHLFYFAWNPATGEVKNLSGSVSVASGSLPILYATATTSFREVDTGSNLSEVPTWCRDSSGNLHVAYFNGNADPYPLYHRIWNGSSWSTPELVVSMNGRGVPRIRYVSLVPKGTDLELWYPDGATGGWTQVGGDRMARRTRSSGVWGSEEVVLTGDGVSALAHPTSVHDAHADLRVMFAESAQTENYADRILAKRYGFGDSGFTEWPEPIDVYENRVIEKVIYQGANGSKPTNVDKSWVASPIAWSGNANIQGNRLALDGTGDYTTIGAVGVANNRRYYFDGGYNKNSGEMCMDLRRVKFANTTQSGACIWARAGTGTTKSILLLFRGELSPKKLSFEYTQKWGSYTTIAFDFTPDTSKEYDIRISRDASGVLRIHMGESGSDLVLMVSASIGTTHFNPITTVPNHGSYNSGLGTLNGSIGATRVTQSDRGTTSADVPAAAMAFDT